MVKYSGAVLDRTFSALSDPTRRDILDRLALGPASISDLAKPHGMSLPGVMKHIKILEEADLVETRKNGRTRECRLGPETLEDATQWMEAYKDRWELRLDRLEDYLAKRKRGDESDARLPARARHRCNARRDLGCDVRS